MKMHDAIVSRNLAYIFLAIYALEKAAMFLLMIPEGNREMVGHSASTLENILLVLAGFFYGSSVGSRMKDKPMIDPDGGPIRTTQTETTKVETQTHQEAKP